VRGRDLAPRKEVEEMVGVEGVFLESLTGSLVPGVLILAMLVAVVGYGLLREEWAHRGTERQPLKKAA
jgi:hypothetical protein